MKQTPTQRTHKSRAKSLAALAALSLTMAIMPARADVNCTGGVMDHLVYHEGTLMIRSSWRNDWTYLCNLQAPWKGVSTEACFTWFGLLTAARTHNKSINIYYVGETACSTLGTYGGAPAPVYVRMSE